MPNRIIKESVNESKTLASCSLFSQDLYKRLITYADDYGRFNADTEIMLARLYPRELSSVTQDDVIEALVELSGIGKIQFYTANARKEVYGCFPNWSDHQRIRDSKRKCPEPCDKDVNDWYLRRFIPIDMKAEIIERDGFKCKICGKFLTTCKDAKRFVKLGSGLYHIDHIVPLQQGGRATLENLRLTCPFCNLTRKKKFSFEEILLFAEGKPPTAETRRELPQVPARIQSESESKTESISEYKAAAPQDVVDAFNRICVSLPKVTKLTESRTKAIKARNASLADFEAVFTSAEQSDFLSGRSGKWTNCGFDWLLNPTNWQKVLEGNYSKSATGKQNAFNDYPQNKHDISHLYEDLGGDV